jgi:hypothetical protein
MAEKGGELRAPLLLTARPPPVMAVPGLDPGIVPAMTG